jgi:hypothetical protein
VGALVWPCQLSTKDLLEQGLIEVYGNDSFIFEPFVPLVHFFASQVSSSAEKSFLAFLMNGEHAFDQHLDQIIERLGRLDAQQGCRQRVAFAGQHLPHPGGIERFGFGGCPGLWLLSALD